MALTATATSRVAQDIKGILRMQAASQVEVRWMPFYGPVIGAVNNIAVMAAVITNILRLIHRLPYQVLPRGCRLPPLNAIKLLAGSPHVDNELTTSP